MFLNIINEKNPDVGGGFGTTLHIAARKGHYQICELILQHVAIKNPKDEFWITPLHKAAENGHNAICQLLIKHIKDKNPMSKFGRTPFHLASLNGHFEVCQTL